MAGHDIIVVGTSAGGVEALQRLIGRLPADLPAAVFVVLHLPPESPSMLPSILNRAGEIFALPAVDSAPIRPGHVYVAGPDRHMVVDGERVRLIQGPRENRHRPSIDVLFRSAALHYGPRVIGVILTGGLDDGVAGLQAIKERGGLVVAQDPQEALFPSMPQAAISNVAVDYVRPVDQIGPLLVELAQQPAQPATAFPVPPLMAMEQRITALDNATIENHQRPGQPSVFSCPECHGVLREIYDQGLLRFRCNVGHAFSLGSMHAEQNEAIEVALWAALNTLEESIMLAERISASALGRGHERIAQTYRRRADDAIARAHVIRQVLLRDAAADSPPPDPARAEDGPAPSDLP